MTQRATKATAPRHKTTGRAEHTTSAASHHSKLLTLIRKMDEAAEALSREYQVSGSMDEVSAAEFDALRELVLKTRAKSNKDRLILASFGRSIASYHYHRVVAICENNPALNADDEFIVKGFADLLCLLGNLSSDLEAVTKTTAQKLGALTPDNSLH